MERTYPCSKCTKTFQKKDYQKDYRTKHMKNQHSYFTCDICKKKIKEGSRPVHLMQCKPETEAQKNVTCNLCNKHFKFDNILHHLKDKHLVWQFKQERTPLQTKQTENSMTDSSSIQQQQQTPAIADLVLPAPSLMSPINFNVIADQTMDFDDLGFNLL